MFRRSYLPAMINLQIILLLQVGLWGQSYISIDVINALYTMQLGEERDVELAKAVTSKDCGKCRYCLDKPKHGGRGILKQCCISRRCQQTESPNR